MGSRSRRRKKLRDALNLSNAERRAIDQSNDASTRMRSPPSPADAIELFVIAAFVVAAIFALGKQQGWWA